MTINTTQRIDMSSDGRAIAVLVVLLAATTLAALVPGLAGADDLDDVDVIVEFDGQQPGPEPIEWGAGDGVEVRVTITDDHGPVSDVPLTIGVEVRNELPSRDLGETDLDGQVVTDTDGVAVFDVRLDRAGPFKLVVFDDPFETRFIGADRLAEVELDVLAGQAARVAVAAYDPDGSLDPNDAGYHYDPRFVPVFDGPVEVVAFAADPFGNAVAALDAFELEEQDGVAFAERFIDPQVSVTGDLTADFSSTERLALTVATSGALPDDTSLTGSVTVTDGIVDEVGRVRVEVQDPQGEPFVDACLELTDHDGLPGAYPSDGPEIVLEAVPPGEYTLAVRDCALSPGPLTYYAGEGQTTVDGDDAATVHVSAFETADLGTLQLAPDARIEGQVVTTATPELEDLSEVCVAAWDGDGRTYPGAVTEEGTFVLDGLAPEPYAVHLRPCSGAEDPIDYLVATFWGGSTTWQAADRFEPELGETLDLVEVTGSPQTLVLGGRIAGDITAPDGQTSVDDALITVDSADAEWVRSATAGTYLTAPLPPSDDYLVGVSPPDDVGSRTFHPSVPAADLATLVAVEPGETVSADVTIVASGQVDVTVSIEEDLDATEICVQLDLVASEIERLQHCKLSSGLATWELVVPADEYRLRIDAWFSNAESAVRYYREGQLEAVDSEDDASVFAVPADDTTEIAVLVTSDPADPGDPGEPSEPAETTTTITDAPESLLSGEDGNVEVTVTADEGSVEGELVQLTDDQDPPATWTATLDGAGTAGFTISPLADGEDTPRTYTATFPGTDELAASTSEPVTVLVQPAPTTLTIDPVGPLIVDPDQPFDLTATVEVATSSGTATPTGEVILGGLPDDDSQTLTVDGSPVTFAELTLPSGQHNLSVTFDGDPAWQDSGPVELEVTVRATSTTTIAVDPEMPQVGQDVAVTVTIVDDMTMSSADGTMTLTAAGDTVTLTESPAGTWTGQLIPQDAGPLQLIATFTSADDLVLDSADEMTVAVEPAATATTLTGPATVDEAETFHLDVEVEATPPGGGTPSGDVAVTVVGQDQPTATGTLDGQGALTFEDLILPPGQYELIASYDGSANHLASASEPFALTVRWATSTTLELIPDGETASSTSRFGQDVTVAVTVATGGPIAGAELDVGVDGQLQTVTLDEQGTTTIVLDGVDDLDVGSVAVMASFTGDDLLVGSTAAATLTVEPDTTQVISQAAGGTSVVLGRDLVVAATVTADSSSVHPEGEVVLELLDAGATDEELDRTILEQGTAALSTDQLSLGIHDIRVRYVPDDDPQRHESGEGDPIKVEVVDPEPLVPSLQVTAGTGAARLQVTADITIEGGEGAVGWKLDPGDGSQPIEGAGTAAQRTHTYSEPGTYRVRVRVSDEVGQEVGTSVLLQVVAPDVPVVARAGGDRIVTAGDDLALHGGASEPGPDVASYTWDLGDGREPLDGVDVVASFQEAGTYEVTLTVEVDGRDDSDTLTVEVEPAAPDALVITVVDTDGGAPLASADVAVVEADGAIRNARADDDGIARLPGLPDGEVWVAAYLDGYLPDGAETVVEDGVGQLTIELTSGEVATGEVSYEQLSPEEAAAAGIILDDPDNELVWEAEIRLFVNPLNPGGTIVRTPFVFNTAEGTTTVRSSNEWSCLDGSCSGVLEGRRVVVSASVIRTGSSVVPYVPTITYLTIPVEGRMLKELFDVRLDVVNLAPPGFPLSDVTAELPLPTGLSLAPTVDGQSTLQTIGDVPGGDSAGVSWIVRGDQPGDYDLTATARGDLEPFGAPVDIAGTTVDPLTIWGASALRFLIEVDEYVTTRLPYGVRLGLENVADIDVHGAQLRFLEDTEQAIYQPRQVRQHRIGTIAPGETAWIDEAILVPSLTGWINLARSEVAAIAGEVPEAEIMTRPVARPADTLGAVTVSNRSDYHVVRFDQIPAELREFYVTPDLDTQFPDDATTVTATSRGDVVAIPRIEDGGELAISSVVGGDRSLEHPVVRLGAGGLVEPNASVRVTDGARQMCGEPATLEVEFSDTLLELASYEIEVGGQLEATGGLSGSTGHAVVGTFQPEDVDDDGLLVRARAFDELGNAGRWSTVRLTPECPSRPVAVLAGGLFSALNTGDSFTGDMFGWADDYLLELYGSPDDEPWESVVGLLTDLGYDWGHDGTGPYDIPNRTLIEYSYRGANVNRTDDGPTFEPVGYPGRDTLVRVGELAGFALTDLVSGAGIETRSPDRINGRRLVEDLVAYDRAWHDAHEEWLAFHLLGHSLGARELLDAATEAQLMADECRDRGGDDDYPCERYEELVGAVVSVSGAVYPVAVAKDIKLMSCATAWDLRSVDLAAEVVGYIKSPVRSALLDGVIWAGEAIQRSAINEELSVVGRAGTPVDTLGTSQDHCLSLSATQADELLPEITAHEHTVASEGRIAHRALIDGTLPDASGDYFPLRRLLEDADRFPHTTPLTPSPATVSSAGELEVAATGGLTATVRTTDGVTVPDGELIAAHVDGGTRVLQADADGEIDAVLPAGQYRFFVNPLVAGQAGSWLGGATRTSADVLTVPENGTLALGDVAGIATVGLTVTLLDADGDAASRAAAGLRDADGDPITGSEVDGSGEVQFADLLPGDYTLEVGGIGWATQTIEVTIDEDHTLDPITLQPAAFVLAELVDEDGTPVSDLLVQVEDGDGQVLDAGFTDVTGTVALTSLPDGDLTARVSDPLETVELSPLELTVTATRQEPRFALTTIDVDDVDAPGTPPPGDGPDPTPDDPDPGADEEDESVEEEPRTIEEILGDVPDVEPGTTHAAGIAYVLEAGIAQGFDDGTFGPRLDITRGQLATMLTAAFDLPPAPPDFPDVSSDSTHAEGIGAAAAAGIVEGYDDGTFGPGELVTREQLASMLFRALGLEAGGGHEFADVVDGATHTPAIRAVAAAGIVEGYDDGMFRPRERVSREQVASMLERALAD